MMSPVDYILLFLLVLPKLSRIELFYKNYVMSKVCMYNDQNSIKFVMLMYGHGTCKFTHFSLVHVVN